jgi:hypothetical protein
MKGMGLATAQKEVRSSSPLVPTIFISTCCNVVPSTQPGFLSVLLSVLVHRPFGMTEDRIEHHLLSRDQSIHIRLGVLVQHRRNLRVEDTQVFCAIQSAVFVPLTDPVGI